MDKKLLLIVLICSYFILMTNSASSVEYRVFDDHNTTMMLSKIKKISITIEAFTFFLKITKRDMNRFTLTQDINILTEKITDLKTIQVNNYQKTSIQLMFQLLIGIIASIVIILFIIGTTFSVVIGSFISSLVVILVSIAIILIKIINNNR